MFGFIEIIFLDRVCPFSGTFAKDLSQILTDVWGFPRQRSLGKSPRFLEVSFSPRLEDLGASNSQVLHQ